MASRSAWVLVYCIGPEDGECGTYPYLLFDRDIFNVRGTMCSVLILAVGDKIYDIYFPPGFLRLWIAHPATSRASRT